MKSADYKQAIRDEMSTRSLSNAEFAERMRVRRGEPTAAERQAARAANLGLPQGVDWLKRFTVEEIALTREHTTIAAIKSYRARGMGDLAVAKRAIDLLRAEMEDAGYARPRQPTPY
jgi:hypothetical protein